MEKNIYWYWENLLNQDQIKEINLICKKYYDPVYKDNPAEKATKTADVKGIRWELLKPVMHHVDNVWRENNKFKFGFDIFQTLDSDMWNFNIYDYRNKGEYDFHIDATNNYISDIKLTGIVNISDEPYEGGEFIAFLGTKFIELPEIKKPGSSILLQHNIVHKVNPVIKGIRKTLSYWLYGPRFI